MDLPFILYKNIFDATVTASGTASDSDPAHVIDWRDYIRWEADATGTKYLYSASGEADCLGIAGHNLSGATVSLEYSATGAWAGEETVEVADFFPTDASPILKTFDSATGYRRLKIVSGADVSEIGVLCAGLKTEFPEYPDAPLDFISETSEADITISKGGHLLGVSSKYCPYDFSFNFTYFPQSWVTQTFRPFWRDHGKLYKPFFVSINGASRFCRFPDRFRLVERMADGDFLESFNLQFEGIA